MPAQKSNTREESFTQSNKLINSNISPVENLDILVFSGTLFCFIEHFLLKNGMGQKGM